ncbi:MAG: hypothetical protein FWJ62_02105 [Thermaerobacter sp.]
MFWLGLLTGLAAGWCVYAFAFRQQVLQERRRLLTLLEIELTAHAERLDICRKAGYGVPLPVVDWPWVRHHLPGHLDRGSLGLLAAYYAALEAGWNRRFAQGTALDPEDLRLASDLAERNGRLQERLAREIDTIREVRVLGLTWLRQQQPPDVRPAERLTAAPRA